MDVSSRNFSSWKTKACLFRVVNTMAAADLVKLGTRATIAILTSFSRMSPASGRFYNSQGQCFYAINCDIWHSKSSLFHQMMDTFAVNGWGLVMQLNGLFLWIKIRLFKCCMRRYEYNVNWSKTGELHAAVNRYASKMHYLKALRYTVILMWWPLQRCLLILTMWLVVFVRYDIFLLTD